MRDNESRQWRRELARALLLLVWGTWENSSTLLLWGMRCGQGCGGLGGGAECRYVGMSHVNMSDWQWGAAEESRVHVSPTPWTSFKVRWHAQAFKYRRWTQGRASRWARGDLGPTSDSKGLKR